MAKTYRVGGNGGGSETIFSIPNKYPFVPDGRTDAGSVPYNKLTLR